MNTPTFNGIVRFKVAGQKALSKWAQQAIANALSVQESPPEALRFQCRIATDARENFAEVKLKDGGVLTLHPKSNPQFGKNHEGKVYLTVTVVYSITGETYRLRWIGPAVPPKMIDVAVKHDQGLAVKPAMVGLDLSKAEVTPTYKVGGGGRKHRSTRNYKAEYARRKPGAGVEGGVSGRPRPVRNCHRPGESDRVVLADLATA